MTIKPRSAFYFVLVWTENKLVKQKTEQIHADYSNTTVTKFKTTEVCFLPYVTFKQKNELAEQETEQVATDKETTMQHIQFETTEFCFPIDTSSENGTSYKQIHEQYATIY